MIALHKPKVVGPIRVGAAWLLAAQAVFMVTGYALHVVLGRRLGPVEYGLFGIVLYASNMIRTFVSSGMPMAVTRYVSAEPHRAEAVYRAGFRLQGILGLSVSLLFFIFAAPAAGLLGDPALAPLFRMVAPIVVFYGLLFLIIQYWNGLRFYRLQSALLAVSYLLRLALVVSLALLGWRVLGAVAGLVIATALAWAAAVLVRRSPGPQGSFPASTLIVFASPLVLAAVVQALLTDLDIMFVKRLIPEAAAAGWYTSAKALAQITPFAFYALSSALYPSVSRAWANGDLDLLKRYVEQSNRWLIMTIIPLLMVVFWEAEGLLNLVYGPHYLEAAPALRGLMVSFALLSVFVIHKTIITGCGFPRIAGMLTLVLLPLFVVLQLVFIPKWGLAGAAGAAAVTFGVGVFGSSGVLWAKIGAGLNRWSVLRLLIAGGGLALAEVILSFFPMPLLLKLTLLVLVYGLLIWGLGELRRSGLRDLASRLHGPGNVEP